MMCLKKCHRLSLARLYISSFRINKCCHPLFWSSVISEVGTYTRGQYCNYVSSIHWTSLRLNKDQHSAFNLIRFSCNFFINSSKLPWQISDLNYSLYFPALPLNDDMLLHVHSNLITITLCLVGSFRRKQAAETRLTDISGLSLCKVSASALSYTYTHTLTQTNPLAHSSISVNFFVSQIFHGGPPFYRQPSTSRLAFIFPCNTAETTCVFLFPVIS